MKDRVARDYAETRKSPVDTVRFYSRYLREEYSTVFGRSVYNVLKRRIRDAVHCSIKRGTGGGGGGRGNGGVRRRDDRRLI